MSQATLGSTSYQNSSLFSGYYLDERIDDLEGWDCDDEAEQAFEELQQLWKLEGDLVASYNEDELLGSWIDEVIDTLGFGTLSETTLPDAGGYNDRLLFNSEETRRDAAKRKGDGRTEAMYGLASAVLEAKQWDADFTKRFNEQRSYRDASHQIKYYLERTPERLKWGVLTNGKKWRLYGTKDYATEIYYEVDLPELLETGNLEQFKYFYTFFRAEAFREVAGNSFLDTVWNESETAAQELGEDLQDNVFTALRVLGEGFIHTNDLDIDPDDEDARAELKEQSLVLLYRLIFVLYAESRGLIHPNDTEKQAEYDEHFSLDKIRLDIHDRIDSGDRYEDYSGYATQIWGQLEDLFGLVDEGQEDLGIPPYNGGLFDEEQHTFLAENQVADRYIAEVIHRLGTTKNDGTPVLADYADLDTRHLGSIYEGLLEHEFRIAPEQYAAVAEDGSQIWKPATEVSVAEAVETVEKGDLYVVNDEGERKATGAYYTPDYVVSYIIEETVDPLLDDIKTDLEADGLEPSDREYFARFWRSVLELKILDPAMGSAHFLTNATGYLTEQVMEIVREQEIQGYDEQYMRRQIAKECIYGVDINEMAVELGKLSMWLETLAADQPLAFLDHHIKPGNSLVGSNITNVLSDDAEENGGQLTLGQAFARARQQTLDHVMDLMQELLAIDNETLEDIKSMEEIYKEIQADPLYQRLFEIANVHTAEEFGLDVPDGVYEQMASAIEEESEWEEIRTKEWFTDAQSMADDQQFFHWELEFPEVFFDIDGEKLERAGFDTVVGNPPYVRQEFITQIKEYLQSTYEVFDGRGDLYSYFLEKGNKISSDRLGYIVSHKFTKVDSGEPLRDYLSDETTVSSFIDFQDLPVFGEQISAYPAIIIASKTVDHKNLEYTKIDDLSFGDLRTEIESTKKNVPVDTLGTDEWTFISQTEKELRQKMRGIGEPLSEVVGEPLVGIKTGLNEVYIIDSDEIDQIIENNSERDVFRPFIKGKEIKRYTQPDPEKYLLFPYERSNGQRYPIDLDEYPGISTYLHNYKERLEQRYDIRNSSREWYELRACDYYDVFEKEKIIYPDISDKSNFTIDTGTYVDMTGFLLDTSNQFYLGLLNSSLLEWYLSIEVARARGGYLRFKTQYMEDLPLIKDNNRSNLPDQISEILQLKREKSSLNLSLEDHLGSYTNGPPLAEVGFTQPPEGAADSILQETTKERSNLRVGEASVVRKGGNTVEIQLTARYKPDDEDAYETDRWGYTETESLPALRITELTETEADLIEHFVPVAVDEAGGFADFRETATKTNSLVDRLQKLTLPSVNDVHQGLESYLETKERAEELDKQIERTDDLIDEIVYELYGLTDEEIKIVEEAIGQ